MSTVTIDGLTFRSDGDTGYVYSDLEGWYSGAPMRADVVLRPNADGVFGMDRVYRGARPLLFRGALLADEAETAQAVLWQAFSSIQSAGAPITFTVSDVTGVKSVQCTLEGAPRVEKINSWAAFVEASFIAFDPVKYGEPVVTSVGVPAAGGGLQYPLHNAGVLEYGAVGELGRVTVENTGTAKTYPFITVLGGVADGFRVSRLDTGEAVQYDRAVPDGTVVTLDFRTGTVLVDGVSDASSSVSQAQFFGVEPGLSVEVQFTPLGATSGAPQMAVELSSGWW